MAGTGITLTPALEFTVYPNPSNGMVNIQIAGITKTVDYTLSLFDVAGRMVYAGQFKWEVNEERMLDFSGLPGGIYYLKGASSSHTQMIKILIR